MKVVAPLVALLLFTPGVSDAATPIAPSVSDAVTPIAPAAAPPLPMSIDALTDRITRSPAEGGLGGISLDDLRSRSADSHVVFEPRAWWSSWPAGDLDGDTFDDVFTYQYTDADQRIEIVARSGRTGSILYRTRAPEGDELGPGLPNPPRLGGGSSISYVVGMSWSQELTGDGVSDVLFIDVDQDRAPGYAGTDRMLMEFTLVDGTNGERLWSRAFQGSRRFAPNVERYKSWPMSLDLIPGNGSPATILMETVDATTIRADELRGRGTATMHAVNGATGSSIPELRLPFTGGVPEIWHGGDLVGDAEREYLALTPTIDGIDLSVLDRSGSKMWTRSLPAATYTWVYPVQLDAAGSDLIAYRYRMVRNGSFTEYRRSLSAVDGANGTPMWSVPESDPSSYDVVDDLDGDGGADVATVTDARVATLSIRSGADLSPLSSRTYDLELDEGYTGAWSPGDLDGDGTWDLVLYRYDGDGDVEVDIAVSGATLEPLWSVGPSADLPRFVYGDVAGSPGYDLASWDEDTGILELLDGADLAPLATITLPRGIRGIEVMTADLDPASGNEIFLDATETGPSIFAYRLDGTQLWRVQG